MKADKGVIYALLKDFNSRLYPTAVEIDKRLRRGERLTAEELDYLQDVMTQVGKIAPLVARNPEYADLAAAVMSMYCDISRQACLNEAA